MNRISMFLLCIMLVSCSSTKDYRIQSKEFMYLMVYDYNNQGVASVDVIIDGKNLGSTDIYGRFNLSLEESKEYKLTLSKSGYEPLSQDIKYDTLMVGYFKIINANQLLQLTIDSLDDLKYQDSLTYINRALVLEPTRSDILYLKSIILYKIGEIEESKKNLELIEKRPSNAIYIDELWRLNDENK